MRAAAGLALVMTCWCGIALAKTSAPIVDLPPVEVIGASPLIGSGVPRNLVPAQTQVLDSGDLQRQGMPDLLKSLDDKSRRET